jgi:PP-loop superfamily ATP-utilizing enzyme
MSQGKSVHCITSIQHRTESPSQSNQTRERHKGIRIRKEYVNLSLFANDVIIHTENPKYSTKKKLLKLINESGKVAGYKINIQN